MSFIVSENSTGAKTLTQLNPDLVHFSEVKFIGKTNPRKIVNVSYDKCEKLVLQSPEMKIPYEIKGQSFDGSAPKYDINVSFNDDDPKHIAFKNTIKGLDDLLKNKPCNDDDLSRKWLKQKSPSPEVSAALYNPMLKVHKNKDTGEPSGLYPDSLRIKLPYYKKMNEEEGKFAFDLFDQNTKEMVDKKEILQNLQKGSTCKLLIENTGVYFVNGKYGLSWKVVQASVKKPKVNYETYSFIDDSEDRDIDVQSLDDDE